MVLVTQSFQFFATPRTVTLQAALSMRFSRPEYCRGLQFPSPGDLPNPGIKPISLMSPALASGFFTTSTTWEVPYIIHTNTIFLLEFPHFYLHSKTWYSAWETSESESEVHLVESNSLRPRGLYSPWTSPGQNTGVDRREAFPFSRRSSQPRDQTQVSHIAGKFFTDWASREALISGKEGSNSSSS